MGEGRQRGWGRKSVKRKREGKGGKERGGRRRRKEEEREKMKWIRINNFKYNKVI